MIKLARPLRTNLEGLNTKADNEVIEVPRRFQGHLKSDVRISYRHGDLRLPLTVSRQSRFLQMNFV